MNAARILLPVILALGLSSCVSKSKYTSLESDLAQERNSLKQSQEKIQELETLVAQLESQLGTASSDKEALQSSVQEMRTALSEMTARKQEVENRIRDYQDLVQRFQKLTDAGQLSVKIVDGRMVVELPSDVLFASGSANLSAAGTNAIKEVTKVLNDIPNREYQVEGHTDNVPIRTSQFPSNWELASARGVNVVQTMIASGMPPARVSAASFGEFRPISDNDSPEGRASNRRIEIVIVPDLSTLPGYDELQKLTKAE